MRINEKDIYMYTISFDIRNGSGVKRTAILEAINAIPGSDIVSEGMHVPDCHTVNETINKSGETIFVESINDSTRDVDVFSHLPWKEFRKKLLRIIDSTNFTYVRVAQYTELDVLV